MKNFSKAAIVLGAIVIANTSFAAKGVVVHYPGGCDYYIVETNMGYVLLEWYGGSDPREGDALVGDFEAYGMKTIFNLTQDSETRVWVEDYWLDEESVIENFYEQCG